MVDIETCKRIGCKRLIRIAPNEKCNTQRTVCWHMYCPIPSYQTKCCYECTLLGQNRPNKENPNQCYIEDKDLYFRFIFAYRKEKRMNGNKK